MLFDYGLDGLEYDVNNDDDNNDIALNSGSIGETIKRLKAIKTKKLAKISESSTDNFLFSIFGNWVHAVSKIVAFATFKPRKIDYMLGLDDKSFAFELAKIKNSVTELQEVSED